MPIYEYKCENCGYEFEEMLHFSEREDPLNTPCSFPTCGGKVHLKMSLGSFHLKGSGWYKMVMVIKNQCPKRKRLKDQQSKLQVPIPKQEKVKSFLKNLLIPKLLKPDLLLMIKTLLIILLLTGCAADKKHSERWIARLETLPRVKGYVVTGIFELGKNLMHNIVIQKEINNG